MRRERASWVYFVRRVDGEGPVKIGCSQCPPDRLVYLMAWAPYPLEIAATIPGDEDLEQRFHQRFLAQHTHREWFDRSPALDEAIRQVAAGEFDTESLPPAKRLRSIRRAKPWTAEQRLDLSITHRVGRFRGEAWFSLPEWVRLYCRTSRCDRTAEARARMVAFLDVHAPLRTRSRAA